MAGRGRGLSSTLPAWMAGAQAAAPGKPPGADASASTSTAGWCTLCRICFNANSMLRKRFSQLCLQVQVLPGLQQLVHSHQVQYVLACQT